MGFSSSEIEPSFIKLTKNTVFTLSLFTVSSGPSAKGKSQAEWKKLGTLIGSINVLKRISESKQKEREVLKEVEVRVAQYYNIQYCFVDGYKNH